MIRSLLFFLSLTLTWMCSCPIKRYEGSRCGRKDQLSLLTRWSELGKFWPRMGWRHGGHIEFRTQCGVEPCCCMASCSLGQSRLDVHLLGFLLRLSLGALGRKSTTPTHVGGVAVIHFHGQTYLCFTVSCLFIYMCFVISFFSVYKKRNDLLWPYRPKKSLYILLIRKGNWNS